MASYTYVPFPESSLDDNGRNTDIAINGGFNGTVIYSNLSIWDSGGTYIGSTRGHFIDKQQGIKSKFKKAERVLSVVQPNDDLYINAHGLQSSANKAVNSGAIAATVCNASRNGVIAVGMRPAVLASRMEKEGLNKGIVNIFLTVCFAGIDNGTVFPDDVAHSIGDNAIASPVVDCLARTLAIDLGARGYNSVRVSGACGPVVRSQVIVGYVQTKYGPSSRSRSLSQGSRYFNSQGHVIP